MGEFAEHKEEQEALELELQLRRSLLILTFNGESYQAG